MVFSIIQSSKKFHAISNRPPAGNLEGARAGTTVITNTLTSQRSLTAYAQGGVFKNGAPEDGCPTVTLTTDADDEKGAGSLARLEGFEVRGPVVWPILTEPLHLGRNQETR